MLFIPCHFSSGSKSQKLNTDVSNWNTTNLFIYLFYHFKRFKTECQSLLMIYAKKDKEGTSYNTGNASNAPLYQRAACYFLALLSFLRMKGNSKKDLQHAREGKVRRGRGVEGWG